jgi:hypothetical protein
VAKATSKYDVSLNGQGYILVEESYREKAQQPFVPRFSTGDPGYGDLSFWQFLSQEDFAGEGQKRFSTINLINASFGWDLRNGKAKVQYGRSSAAIAALDDYQNIGAVVSETGNLKKGSVLLGPTALWVIYPSNTGTSGTVGDDVSVYDGYCGCRYSRGTESGILVGRTDATLTIEDRAGQSAFSFAMTNASPKRALLQISANVFAAISGVAATGNQQFLTRLTLNGGSAWTVAAEKSEPYSYGTHRTPYGAIALDSSGTLYFIAQAVTSGVYETTLYASVSLDFLATDGPRISTTRILAGFVGTDIAALGSSIYIFGSKVTPAGVGRETIIDQNGNIVWQGYDNTSGIKIIRSVSKDTHTRVLFMARSLLGPDSMSVYEITTTGLIRELASFASESAGNEYIAAFLYQGKVEALQLQSGSDPVLHKTNTTRGSGLSGDSNASVLLLSEMGANTPLINKTLYSATIELSEAVPSGGTMTVKVNDTTIGTMVLADGTRKEIILATDLTTSSFAVKLQLPGTVAWDGELNRVTLRYVPTQFKKKAWGFGVRATRNLKLIDGSYELESPASLFSDVKTAWSSNVPITFIDIDGTSYTVIVTDYDRRVPLLDRRTGKTEQLLFVELLEV